MEPGDATLLLRAVEVLEPVRDAVKQKLEAFDQPWAQPQPISAGDLGPEAIEALDALVAWYEERGGLPPGDCSRSGEQATRALRWIELGKVALMTAPDARHPQIAAALYLGYRLRAEGVSLLQYAIGVDLAARTARWASQRSWAPSPVFTELAPDPGTPVRAVAVEAICSRALAEQWRRDASVPDMTGEDRRELDTAPPALRRSAERMLRNPEQGLDAELADTRRLLADAVFRVNELRDHPSQAIDALDQLADKAHRGEYGLVAQVLGGALGHQLRRLVEDQQRYASFLRTGRWPERDLP
ncbi:MAG TPA: hypothetical protein VL172_00865 [Kofleriaceae bacterium]|nr:hypothetical protein [Kofleriaceae bacterium]